MHCDVGDHEARLVEYDDDGFRCCKACASDVPKAA